MKKVGVFSCALVLIIALLAAPSLAAQANSGSAAQQSSQFSGQGTLQNAFLMSDLVNKRVTNPQGEHLGTVDNVVIGPDGRVSYIILSPPRGIKGSGEVVAVPWNVANPTLQNNNVSLNLSRNQLQNAPAIQKSNLAELQSPQMQQRVNSYFGSSGMQQGGAGGMQPGELQGETREEGFDSGAQEQQGLGPEDSEQGQSQQGWQGGALEQGPSQEGLGRSSGIRANFRARSLAAEYPQATRGGMPRFRLNNVRMEQLLGQPVLSQQGQQLGSIEDFVLDQNGQIRYIVIARSHGAGFTGDLTAVPWSAAQPNFRANQMYVNLTQQRLANAPHFSRNQFSQLANPEFRQRLFSYYGAEPTAGGFGMGGFRANAIIGETVTNPQGQELGTVRDLFTNENGCIKYAIIAPSESLQMGDKQVAIPWNMVQADIQGGRFLANISPDRLRNAPSFDRENWRNYVNNPQFDQQVNSYFGGMQQGALFGRPSAYGAFSMLRASQLVGEAVTDSQGATLGRLEDLVTDNSGRIKYLLIAPEETMGMANRLVAVPWDAAAPQLRQNQILINISQKRFTDAPSLTRGNLQQLNNPQWERSIRSYFGTEPGFYQRGQEMQQRLPESGQEMQQGFPQSQGMQQGFPEEPEEGGMQQQGQGYERY